MQLTATENQTMITQAVRDLVRREVRPNVMEWDEPRALPQEALHGPLRPRWDVGRIRSGGYGGAGLGYHEYVNTIVEVARVCGSIRIERGRAQFALQAASTTSATTTRRRSG